MREPAAGGELASRADVSNVLLLATSREPDVRGLCQSLLWPPDAETVSVVGVATRSTPDGWAEEVLGRLDRRPTRVCVVGVDEQARSSAAGQPQTAPGADVCVKWAEGPGNLTAVGVRITECVDAVGEAAERTSLCVESLVPFLDNVETRAAFQFLHTLTSLVTTKDAVAHYHVDPADADERDLGKLTPLFDAVVDRDAEGDLAVRTR